MASVNDIVQKATKRNWFLTDNFEVYFHNPKIPDPTENFGSTLQTCVINVTVPALNAAPTDIILGGERRIGVQIFETFKYTITFRDFNSGQLRRYFEAIFISQQYEYFNDIKSTITMYTNDGTLLFHTEDSLITSISEFTLDNLSTQIAEFAVSFEATRLNDDLISGFGSEKVSELFSKDENGNTEISFDN